MMTTGLRPRKTGSQVSQAHDCSCSALPLRSPAYISISFLVLSPASGRGRELVIEADEYGGAFLALAPVVAVVTNVEWDHVDLYRSPDEYTRMFLHFADQIRDGGTLIACGDDPGARMVADHVINSTEGKARATGSRGLLWEKGARVLSVECGVSIADYRLPISDYRLPIIDCRFPITDYRLPISDFQLPTAKCALASRLQVATAAVSSSMGWTATPTTGLPSDSRPIRAAAPITRSYAAIARWGESR